MTMLCFEMNIWKSVSPDLDTIIIYDVGGGKILFPTADKSFIYNGTIDKIEKDGVSENIIRYSSYTKLNGIVIENEKSVIGWNGNEFDTLDFNKKLILETDEYVVFYEKSTLHEDASFKLLILNPNTLDLLQKLEFIIDDDITKRIKNQELVKQIYKGSYDLYIEDYGILYWDHKLKIFE